MKKLILAAALVTTSLVPAAAMAGGVATSYLRVYDFIFRDVTGGGDDGALVVGDDISILGVGSVSTIHGDQNVAVIGGANDNDNAAQPVGLGAFDMPALCVGNAASCAAYTENDFTGHTPDGADATTTYALADLGLVGTTVDFGGGATGADATTMVDLNSVGENSTSGENNITLGGLFVANKDLTVELDYMMDYFFRTFFSPDQNGGVSFATGQWTVEINSSAGQVFYHSISFSEFAAGVDGFRAPPALADTGAVFGSDLERQFNLVDGTLYSFSISHETKADLNTVPAPGVVAMMGLGLLGLAAIRRRRARA